MYCRAHRAVFRALREDDKGAAELSGPSFPLVPKAIMERLLEDEIHTPLRIGANFGKKGSPAGTRPRWISSFISRNCQHPWDRFEEAEREQ